MEITRLKPSSARFGQAGTSVQLRARFWNLEEAVAVVLLAAVAERVPGPDSVGAAFRVG
jgi:hypothetical protein